MVGGASLRIVFFGTPSFAVPSLTGILTSPHAVVGVVTQPDRPSGRGHHVHESPVKHLARERSLPIFQPDRMKDPAFVAALIALDPDLGVVAAYGRILTNTLLTTPRLGMINVHASLLPRYRGAAPVHRAVQAGERETGVTIMQVVPELDAGPIFATAVRPIGPDETSQEVEDDLAHLGARLLVRVIGEIAAGASVALPQDAHLATYAPRLTKSEGRIDWRRAGASIHNQVRGLQRWPQAFTYLGRQRVIILQTQLVDRPTHTLDRPGTVVERRGDRLTVAAGDGTLLSILRIQPEGRRPMSAREFLAGHALPNPAVFSETPGPAP